MKFDQFKRRDLIALLGGAAATWPLAARAQQPDRVRRIGVLMPFTADNAEGKSYVAALGQGLQEQGWMEGRNIRFDTRWGGGDVERTRAYAAELVGLAPDVIFACLNAQLAPLSRETRTLPIVFIGASDPLGSGYIASYARPGGNITGLTSISGDIIAKRLQLIRELLPNLARVAILVREGSPTESQYVKETRAAARNLGIELQIESKRTPQDLDAIFVAVQGSGALVVADDAEFTAHRARIAELALLHRLPTVSGLSRLLKIPPNGGGLLGFQRMK